MSTDWVSEDQRTFRYFVRARWRRVEAWVHLTLAAAFLGPGLVRDGLWSPWGAVLAIFLPLGLSVGYRRFRKTGVA